MLGVLSVLVLAPSLVYPPGRDQGMFAYAARLVLGGAVPFRDFWDTKPPAIYYVYALSEILFGYSIHAIRWLDLFWQIATAMVLFMIARRLSECRVTAFIAGCVYIAAYASRGWWNTAQPDDFLNLPLAVAVLLLMRGLERQRFVLLSLIQGVLVGVAFYFRYPMGLMLAVCMAVLLMGKGRNAATFQGLASMMGGFVICAGGYALYLYLSGAWGEFLYTEFTWAREYGRLGAAPATVAGILHLGDIFSSHFSFVSIAIVALVGYALTVREGRCDRRVKLIALWALVALLNLYMENKFYIYHFAPLAAPLAIGASLALGPVFTRRMAPLARRAVVVALILAIAVPFLTVNRRYNLYCAETYMDSERALLAGICSGKELRDYYMNVRFTSDDFSFPADLVVADYIRDHTRPGEPVFIWGCETLVYYLAGRQNASRFIHNFPFRCGWTDPRFGSELLNSLIDTRPSYVLLVRNDPSWWATGTWDDSVKSLREYPEIERFIADNYSFDRRIEDFLIFRRKQ